MASKDNRYTSIQFTKEGAKAISKQKRKDESYESFVRRKLRL